MAEWIRACKKAPKRCATLPMPVRLQANHLGKLPTGPKGSEWDAKNMKIQRPGGREVSRRAYRKGWKLAKEGSCESPPSLVVPGFPCRGPLLVKLLYLRLSVPCSM